MPLECDSADTLCRHAAQFLLKQSWHAVCIGYDACFSLTYSFETKRSTTTDIHVEKGLLGRPDFLLLPDGEQSKSLQARSQIEATIPLQNSVNPAEVAYMITWLCSRQAASITGQAFNISGGEFTS